MMLPMQDHLPIVFTTMVQEATVHLRQNAIEPLRVVVLFGEGAMEEVPVDLLRRLFSVDRLWDVAVEFPEQAGVVAGMIEVTAEAEDHYVRRLLSPAQLIASR